MIESKSMAAAKENGRPEWIGRPFSAECWVLRLPEAD
jgi:hypothetical protein